MTEYKCLDCGSDMQYEGGLYWNITLTECFYIFKCTSCGSKFEHRLTKEEEDELKERGRQRKIECSICGRSDLLIPPDPRGFLRALLYDNAIIVCEDCYYNCRNVALPENIHGEEYILDITPETHIGWLKMLWRKLSGK